MDRRQVQLVIFTLCLMIIPIININAFVVNGISYQINNSNALTLDVVSKSPKYSGKVVIPTVVNYNGRNYTVTRVRYAAFYGCEQLTEITLPETLTSIGDMAFYGCSSLSSIVIPEKVLSIGQQAFSECNSLKTLYYNAKDCTTEWPNSAIVGDYDYPGWHNLTHVTIGANVTRISDYTFANSKELISVQFEDNCMLKTIEDYAFCGCSKLSSLVLPRNVETIGSSAFYECNSLYSMSFPTNLVDIGNSAFYGCSSLISVDLPSRLKSIGAAAFAECAKLKAINIEEGNINYKSIGGIVYNPSVTSILLCPAAIEEVVLPSTVTALDDYSFSGCSKMKSIQIPNTMTRLGNYCFSGCSSISSIVVPASIIKMGYGCFYGCSGLESIKFNPNDNLKIESLYDMFNMCANLKEVDFSSVDISGLTNISYAFNDCAKLEKIDFTNYTTLDIKYGYNYMFKNSKSINTVYSRTLLPSKNKDVTFMYLPNISTSTTLYVPAGSEEIYEKAEGWRKFKNIKPLPTNENYSTRQNSIYINDIIAETGETVNLGVFMNNNSDIKSFKFELCLPREVYMNGNIRESSLNVRTNLKDEHFVYVDGTNFGNSTITANKRKIGVASVNIDEKLKPGVYNVEIKNISFTDVSGNVIPIDDTTCSITIGKIHLGDINQDGIVDVHDVDAFAEYILNNNVNNIPKTLGDIDQNGIINLADVTKLINLLLNK